VSNVLITGGTGNLGRYIADELAPKHDVVLFDSRAPEESPFPFETKHPFIRGELTSREDCERVVGEVKPDAIVHLAAIPVATDHPRVLAELQAIGFPEQVLKGDTFYVNVVGTHYLLEAARRHGVKKIVAASTLITLGFYFRWSDQPFEIDYLPFDEEHPNRPEDSYSLSKLINEEMYKAAARAHGIQIVALRPARVAFPHATHRAAVEFDIDPASLAGLGSEAFNMILYVDVRDAAQAFRLALEADGLPPFDVFFIITDATVRGDPREVMLELYPELREKSSNWKPGELPISIEKARRVLGYEPRYSWRQTT
jgi:UDP-glucose 4-epimerase